MRCYLVGGAVRDALLGRAVRERDWLVVGADVETMRARGFQQVGNFFPVFLHPETREEYALARTERKVGLGHQGFSFSPATSVAEDLQRRDLTINALAMDANGRIVDPHGGRTDLHGRWLRHVSPAFGEDPLRILRVARFASQLAPYGFRIAGETLELMREMAATPDYAALSAERVWQESQRALQSPAPWEFWRQLERAGALAPWFSELQALDFERAHSYLSASPGLDSATRWLLLLYALPAPRRADGQLQALHRRLKAPALYKESPALLKLLPTLAATSWSAEAVLTLLESCDALRRPQRLERLLAAALSCGLIDAGAVLRWRGWLQQQRTLPLAHITAQLHGAAIPQAVRAERLRALGTTTLGS